MSLIKTLLAACILLTASVIGLAQNQAPAAPRSVAAPGNTNSAQHTGSERWNVYYQATSIGDYHGTFYAPYAGPLSLLDQSEHDVSLTTTLFFAARIKQNTFLVFDPEIAGGRGGWRRHCLLCLRHVPGCAFDLPIRLDDAVMEAGQARAAIRAVASDECRVTSEE